jgi:GAF domain-containing protein
VEVLVGYVTGRGLARNAQDVAVDSIYLDNPDLPDTLSELALPLKIAAETIGALDLQSVEPDAFSQDDIEVLSILANQLTIAIQNARFFESGAWQRKTLDLTNSSLKNLEPIRKDQPVFGYHFDGIEAVTRRRL